jgi:2-methylisocitrate lyase-like PEP mutase family enzyme
MSEAILVLQAQTARAVAFRALHDRLLLVLANAWDVTSAR